MQHDFEFASECAYIFPNGEINFLTVWEGRNMLIFDSVGGEEHAYF